MGIFNDRKILNSKKQVPVWFMRQAGRYHSHYQNIKKNSDFMTMCKNPSLACEITMGPIEDFKFDAAILFSDLLFPLEQMGMGLSYEAGPPTLDIKIDSLEDIKKLKISSPANIFYHFQKEALELLKSKLSPNTTLLGFVGAPFTLYAYAVEGAHAGSLISTKKGFYDGRFKAFLEILMPNLLENMLIQAQGGADAICFFDTAVGELTHDDYSEHIIPNLSQLFMSFKKAMPHKKIIYYSKLTHLEYLESLLNVSSDVDILGIDWRMDLTKAIKTLGDKVMIYGNLDPAHLHLPWEVLHQKLHNFKQELIKNDVNLDRFIMGLGHGVLQHTPEENVKKTIEFIHEWYY